MLKPTYRDLTVVLCLTIASSVYLIVPALNIYPLIFIPELLILMFLPGYAVLSAIDPLFNQGNFVKKVLLTIGVSFIITLILFLILDYTHLDLSNYSILTIITLISSILAMFRRKMFSKRLRSLVREDEGEFTVDKDVKSFKTKSMSGKQSKPIPPKPDKQPKSSKILTVMLLISLILAIAATAYIIVMPKEGESFTEFYILGPGGKASDYPTNLTTGQEGKLIIGIVNHENTKTSYRLVVTSNNTVQLEQALTLEDGQKIEIPFNFTARDPGERKMEFLLYKLPDNNNIYRSLHMWLNISGVSNEPSA